MQGRGTPRPETHTQGSAPFFGSPRIRSVQRTRLSSRLSASSCQIQLYQVMCGQDQLSNAGTPSPPSACDQVFSPRPPIHTPTPTFVGPRLDKNLSDCRSRLLLFAVDDTRQADPGQHSSLQSGMAASQAGGFQGLAFPLPEGQKLLPESFYPLCTLHETRLDRRRRSGRTNQVGLGLQLDGWMDGQPGK